MLRSARHVVQLGMFLLVLTALIVPRAHAASGVSLFDDDYVAHCPPNEALPNGKCNGLYPVHGPDTSQVALLINGENSYRARIQLLKNAKKTIAIQALIFRGDESGLYVANLLRAKQAEGVKVRVIIDAASNPEPMSWWMYSDLMAHPGLAPIWVKGYGEVVEDLMSSNTKALNNRFHDKLWIIDGDEEDGVAVIGGLNVANEYFRADQEDPTKIWRDQDVAVRGAVVKDLQQAFWNNNSYFNDTQKQPMFSKIENSMIEAIKSGKKLGATLEGWLFHSRQSIKDPIWGLQTQLKDSVTGANRTTITEPPYALSEHIMVHVDQMANDPLPLESMFKPATVRFLHNRPRLKETYIRDAYIERLDSAQSEVLIANAYFLPNPEVLEAIKRAAKRSGVTVSIITNSPETNDLKELSYASRVMYQELIQAGAHVYEWRGDKHGQGTIHAKFAVFDRTSSIVGSYNLDPRSEQLNSETALAFESEDLAGQLANQYIGLDLPNAEEVSFETARRYHENKAWSKITLQTLLSLKFKGQL